MWMCLAHLIKLVPLMEIKSDVIYQWNQWEFKFYINFVRYEWETWENWFMVEFDIFWSKEIRIWIFVSR